MVSGNKENLVTETAKISFWKPWSIPSDRLAIKACIALFLLNVVDMLTTLHAVHGQGFHETNPLMRLALTDVTAFIFIKLAFGLTLGPVLGYCCVRGHARPWSWLMLRLMLIGYVVIVSSNILQIAVHHFITPLV